MKCYGNISYTVSGSVVTVDHDSACKVGYLSGESYVAITAAENADGTYSFTAPDGVKEVALVMKGDVNLDGRVKAQDARIALQASSGMADLDALQMFTVDLNNDGKVKAQEARLLLQTSSGLATISW